MALARLRQQVDGERRRAAEGYESDRHASGERVSGRRGIGLGLLHLPQDDLRVAIHGMSGIGHADALLAADQKLLPEVLLECGELLAERRLSDMQYIRSARDAAGVDNDDKGFEPSDIHRDATGSDLC
ncbi:hypothetical protein GGD55_002247 [Rhizobium giardinii]|uniref:Uncharacterized protein n=1 Tax=Rhizobium giardinii TaxID=56731 RepID=A0A7W8UA74_9HYPH|nr:hypothetical protein [Rhizobium giardinii]